MMLAVRKENHLSMEQVVVIVSLCPEETPRHCDVSQKQIGKPCTEGAPSSMSLLFGHDFLSSPEILNFQDQIFFNFQGQNIFFPKRG